MKEYYPQAIVLGGGVCVKDINDPHKFYMLFAPTPEYGSNRKTWFDAMALELHKQEIAEDPMDGDWIVDIRTAVDNKKRRAEFEIEFYGYLLNEELLYFL